VLFSYRDQVEIGLNEFCPDVSKEVSLETMVAQFKARNKVTLFWYNFEIKRLNDPVYSKNAFTYNLGMNIIKKKYGEFPSVKDFRSLLINPILPSDLL
jgi:hypothetical protein